MATIISNEVITKHRVDKYHFKVLGQHHQHVDNSSEELSKMTPVTEKVKTEADVNIDSSAMSQNSKDALIESLMKKTDEMSTNFIKLQMKLEDKEEEYKTQLEKAKELAYAEGIKAGIEQAKQENKLNQENGIALYSESVIKLENSAKEFEKALEDIKKSLMSAAIDIAKEVINIEVTKESSKIAQTLSNELIKELQSASKITIKVNPADHGFVSEKVGSLEKVEILSDSAVSLGGVIAISDAGNIDSQITNRFEKVKKVALGE